MRHWRNLTILLCLSRWELCLGAFNLSIWSTVCCRSVFFLGSSEGFLLRWAHPSLLPMKFFIFVSPCSPSLLPLLPQRRRPPWPFPGSGGRARLPRARRASCPPSPPRTPCMPVSRRRPPSPSSFPSMVRGRRWREEEDGSFAKRPLENFKIVRRDAFQFKIAINFAF
jgi:hypothetical protein